MSTTQAPAFDTMPIAGEWRRGRADSVTTDRDPYTGETIVEIPNATTDDVDDAFGAAADAQRSWAARSASYRAEVFVEAAAVMQRRKDEVVGWFVRELGAIQPRAEWEWLAVRAVMLEAASYPGRVAGRMLAGDLIDGKENRVYRRPLGTVGVISPWNFPMQLSNRSVAPALAVGNAVVLKPASDSPVTGGLLLAQIFDEAGLPPGLLNVVVGKSSEIGDHLAGHPSSRLTSFTGSTEVGEHLAQQSPLTRKSLELGGNGPLVVLDDADVDRAVDAAVFGSFFHQGQVCMATNRIIVDATIHDRFVDALCARTRALRVGDPRDPSTQIGPIINSSQLDSVRDKVSRARDDGAEIVGGGEPTGPSGLVVPPCVVIGDNSVATAREEVFGPVATVIRADDEDHAVAIADDTDYGLSSAVFSADVDRAVQCGLRIEAGMTHINDTTINDEPNTAFGGEKSSGIGRFGGDWAIEEFTTDHWVGIQRTRRDYAI